MEKINVNLDEVLNECDSHFTWGLQMYEQPFSDPKEEVEGYIKRYNELEAHNFVKRCWHFIQQVPTHCDQTMYFTLSIRFQHSLFLSYIMYRDGLDGWDKMLENSFRIMENTRDPNYPHQGLDLLPSCGSPIYASSAVDFFAHTVDVSAISTEEKNVHDSVSKENGQEKRSANDEDSFTGLHVAAEHVFYSLKATIMLRIGSSSTEVLELLTHIVHKDDMTPSNRAALLFLKATTIRECGDKGLDAAMEILKAAILSDPGNLRWPFVLIHYSGQKRRLIWGRGAERSEVEPLIEVIDSVLQHDLEPSLRVKYQFEKLQALNEMLYKHQMSTQEVTMMLQSINELKETLVGTTDEPKILAYCAQLYSKSKEIPRAILLVEKALENKPDDTYVNAKASNVYKKGGYLDKALECAEKAAIRGFGSCWQVFDLKRALQHTFDYEEFFCSIIKNYALDEHVKVTHKNAALFYMVQGDYYLALVHFKVLLDKYDSDDAVYGETFCTYCCKRVHAVEAAYNVVSFVLGSSCELVDIERTRLAELCNTVKEEIESKFNLDDFKHTEHVDSKQYIEWLRQKQNRPLTWKRAEGKKLDLMQQSLGYRNNNSSNSESSNYQRQFKNSFAADGPSQEYFGNQRVSRDDNRTAFHDYPLHQSQDRSSGNGGRGYSSSAQNMDNYFGRLGSSIDMTRNDYANTRTTRPKSPDTYNQQKYKPVLRGNWRSERTKYLAWTDGNNVHKIPEEPSASSPNWRVRGNDK